MSIRTSLTCIVVVACGPAVLLMAAESGKPDRPKVNLPKTGEIRFDRHVLVKNKNEGISVADINRDGTLDLTAGPFWFEGPTWKQHVIREVPLRLNDEFMANNGEHAFDVNGDGWPDVIAGSWFEDQVWWFENPGKAGLADGRKWKQHVITTGKGETEGLLLEDLDEDGTPELILNSWSEGRPVSVVRITPGKEGSEPKFQDVTIGGPPGGHGMGIGDVNGDGRKDIVVGKGWYEAPESGRWTKQWAFHKFEHELGHTSVPVLVVDVNGDGRNDLIYGEGHDYGLKWREQLKGDGEAIDWKDHLIDDVFSQVHALTWTDLDGDKNMEVVTGKRYRAHGDGDPGAHDPVCLMRYEWDPSARKFKRDVISWDDGVSSGMQILVVDLNADRKLDIAVAGKSGNYVLINRGPAKSGQASR
ncbi:MAG: hypothetical protein AMXMBFR13_49340 [Phycisphaerae bacterium]